MKKTIFLLLPILISKPLYCGELKELLLKFNDNLGAANIPYKVSIYNLTDVFPESSKPEDYNLVYLLKLELINAEYVGVVVGSDYWADNFWKDELHYDYTSFRAYVASIPEERKQILLNLFDQLQKNLTNEEYISDFEIRKGRYLIFKK